MVSVGRSLFPLLGQHCSSLPRSLRAVGGPLTLLCLLVVLAWQVTTATTSTTTVALHGCVLLRRLVSSILPIIISMRLQSIRAGALSWTVPTPPLGPCVSGGVRRVPVGAPCRVALVLDARPT